ncbi:hypothetical protein K435DRAFT_784268 [Dendrothele bispora CBS 962.96]|uniref:CCHC-type domain-containing protein n=1 Tax=Dendrothele bispora (strain CBS 962.96) TaxID=1314807 RepID=A0A4S8L3Z0_DENBC|nr:hypothetical protein K435DRAFT_784268 [Dendrothele bispora CBS 962.96]
MTTKEYENLVVLKGPKELENWKFSLRIKARKKGVWDIIRGTQLLPNDSDTSSEANTLRTKMSVAADLIVQTISPSLIPHIREFPDDPYKMYERLLEVNSHGFEDVSDTWTRFNSLKLRSNETGIEFIGRFRELRSELIALNDKPSDTLSISVLLSALPDVNPKTNNETDWKSFKVQMKRDIQGDDLVYVEQQVLREYSRQNPDGDTTLFDPGEEALAAARHGTRAGGGNAPRVPASDPLAHFVRPHLVCNLCGGLGHFRSQCPSELFNEPSGNGRTAAVATFVAQEEDYSGQGVAF